MSYSFTPTLSLRIHVQPFFGAGEYGGERPTDPKAVAFADRFQTFTGQELAYVPKPDGWGTYEVDRHGDDTADFSFGEASFNFKELGSNVGECRPGSTLFVVWSQGRSRVDPTGEFRIFEDFDRLLGTAGSSVPAIKMDYWLDF